LAEKVDGFSVAVLPSLAVWANLAVNPPKLGVQYWSTFCSRRSKLPRSCSADVMPAMVRSPQTSGPYPTTLYGVSQRPITTLPQPPCRPTPLLRVANVVALDSGLNAVSSWKKTFIPPPMSSVPRMPKSED